MPTNVFTNSSNSYIKKALKKISQKQFTSDRLIGPKNFYVSDTRNVTNAIELGTDVRNDHIAQYIASSIVSHCFDGWNFIARSIDALLSGDISSSIHFAYYAELRAVMCIMANEGIGIFDRRHIYFDSADHAHVLKRRTHVAADELMSEWSALGSKKENVFRCITVNNRTLKNWIDASGHSSTTGVAASVVNDWFKSWSIDLSLSIDQGLRNEMSYRPHFKIEQVDIQATLDRLIEIWLSLEPSTSNRFMDLDRHLFRIALESLFKMATGKTRYHRRFITFIDNIFDSLGESKTQHLYDFACRRVIPDDAMLLQEGRKDVANNEINFSDPLPMISRGILLMRFATGFSNLMIQDAQLSFNSLQFWWEDIAFKIGITSSKPSGIDTCDLYSDVSAAITNLRSYAPTLTNVNLANSQGLLDLSYLKQFQRTCFWGLGL